MKKTTIALSLILLFPTFAFGAQVFGSLKCENKSVGEGVEIRIRCGEKGERVYPGKTDSFGSYSVYLPQPGKCTFEVNFSGRWSGPYDIYSDATDPVRYDFELVRQSDGSFKLERR